MVVSNISYLYTPILGEIIQFDLHTFFNWVAKNHQLDTFIIYIIHILELKLDLKYLYRIHIYMGVSKNRGGPPKWMGKIMDTPIKMDDLGGVLPPLSLETPIYIYIIYIGIYNLHFYPNLLVSEFQFLEPTSNLLSQGESAERSLGYGAGTGATLNRMEDATVDFLNCLTIIDHN